MNSLIIKSSNRNLLDDFENFFNCNIFLKWKPSDLWWAVGSIPILITLNMHTHDTHVYSICSTVARNYLGGVVAVMLFAFSNKTQEHRGKRFERPPLLTVIHSFIQRVSWLSKYGSITNWITICDCFLFRDLTNFILNYLIMSSESKFNEFESRLKSPKKRVQLSLNLETLNTILSGTNNNWAIKILRKMFKNW